MTHLDSRMPQPTRLIHVSLGRLQFIDRPLVAKVKLNTRLCVCAREKARVSVCVCRGGEREGVCTCAIVYARVWGESDHCKQT